MHTVVHMISSPRNISTALMYAFSRRPGYRIIDEPFYACYLHKNGVVHPGFDAIVASQPEDPERVKKNLAKKAEKSDLFIKNMSHHMDGINLEFLKAHRVLMLIRDPKLQIASFSGVSHNPTMKDIGIKAQVAFFDQLRQMGKEVVIVDSGDLLRDPEQMLKRMCTELDLPFTNKMLKWSAEPIEEGEVWAKYWNRNVHRSTGFETESIADVKLEGGLDELHQEALPFYRRLQAQRITVD